LNNEAPLSILHSLQGQRSNAKAKTSQSWFLISGETPGGCHGALLTENWGRFKWQPTRLLALVKHKMLL